MKTSHALLESEEFCSNDIVIPERDLKTYDKNKQHPVFGDCVTHGDYLDTLKKIDPSLLRFVYADFMGHFRTYVEPLLQYLETVKNKLPKGLVIGITWSNNGSGTTTTRNKIQRSLARYEMKIDLEEMDTAPNHEGYGVAGNMNVLFYQKK